jgi:hypothetical protein
MSLFRKYLKYTIYIYQPAAHASAWLFRGGGGHPCSARFRRFHSGLASLRFLWFAHYIQLLSHYVLGYIKMLIFIAAPSATCPAARTLKSWVKNFLVLCLLCFCICPLLCRQTPCDDPSFPPSSPNKCLERRPERSRMEALHYSLNAMRGGK